jgi:hypothetical protein
MPHISRISRWRAWEVGVQRKAAWEFESTTWDWKHTRSGSV